MATKQSIKASRGKHETIVATRNIEKQILLIRGEKVILDSDLADLYSVETKTLTRAVNRNKDRFPEDFTFQLSKEEFDILRRQSGTSSVWGGRRYRPYAFTEHGIAMLSSVLRSKRAEYGEEIVSTLSRQLTLEYGSGFSTKNLRHMVRFFE